MTLQAKMSKLIRQKHLCQCPVCQRTEAKMFHHYAWGFTKPDLTTDDELMALHLEGDAGYIGVAV